MGGPRAHSTNIGRSILLRVGEIPTRRDIELAGLEVYMKVATGTAPAGAAAAPAITLTDTALNHLMKLKEGQNNKELCLRVGVRQGGCSGMSYVMDFEDRAKIRAEDAVIDYEGFTMVCDPKSLLYLFGMQLDYSNALIGGGFSFSNPNASSTCGCGKSFAA
ncbi:hypothetical protein CBR_g72684 [Chara braunii]|uniref:Core domain-containing protein n=1 Tax=Chara braunii TaxID=69332 RepID=A0A388KA78_CHABU|nr:hypothetical protein CBR_g72684 [Chara braunii]|eukprot:GBG66929.1 hypothetical protein CBR_g72684 [Chara braunii]